MLDCRRLYEALLEAGVGFFTGVPDSLLKDFCAMLSGRADDGRHITAANEGGAIALAVGHYLATGRLSLVYMQNSGQGNAVNPLVSLADPDVYGIPVLLLIGWRGEPGRRDEPQHVKQGKITGALLDTLGLAWEVLPESLEEAIRSVRRAVSTMKERSAPYALVVKKGTFAPYTPKPSASDGYALTREEAIRLVADGLGPRDIVVSTTGKASRELFELRRQTGRAPGRDFLTVGSMGHASQIALGIAAARPDRTVCCLDGDGALIMHMGSLAVIGQQQPRNFRHVVLNNGAHDSVGGQPTAGFDIDIPAVARACRYRFAERALAAEKLQALLQAAKGAEGPSLVEVRVSRGARSNLGRPTSTPRQNKRAFMDFVRS